MFPGMNEADCRVAEFRYHQMVGEGQRQQAAAGVVRTRVASAPATHTIQRRFGAFLVRIGQRLHHAYAIDSTVIGSGARKERAIA